MKRVILVLSILNLMALAQAAKADGSKFFVNSKEVTKLEAFKAAINKEHVMRCSDVELTDKLTFKNIKVNKEQE